MKRASYALSIALLLSPLVGVGLAQQPPAKGTEGSEIKQQESKGKEGQEVRRKAKKKVAGADPQNTKSTESVEVRRKAKKRPSVTDGKLGSKEGEASDVKK